MIRAALVAALLGTPAALWAQDVSTAPFAELRGLDRLSGELTEFDVQVGGTVLYQDLIVTVSECRYPSDNPSGDAYAFLEIKDRRVQDPVFEGWMIASSPALNALDHMRYDVWVIRCNTE